MSKWRTAALVVVVDFLLGILLMQQAILALSTIQTQKPHVPTYGQYAVEIQWPLNQDDVDLYVQDPKGEIVYFAAADAGLMHLEHDDLGSNTTGYDKLPFNYERVILRGTIPGEYTVNVHMYYEEHPGTSSKVKVTLWSLQGQDKIVKQTTVTLRNKGDEHTAFRFEMNGAGQVTGTNDLQKKLVNSAYTPGGYNGGVNNSPPYNGATH